ncbi:MAG: DUF4142 domain-containing protein [Acetobacteraceae bacterium]|nr:DUF4142 domain-containing protein [Acetobacteraceae bacterium]
MATDSGISTGPATSTGSSGSPFLVIPSSVTPNLSHQDRSFLQQANKASLTEILAGQQALDKAPDVGTREFARWMVTDHTSAGSALGTLAQEIGVSLSSTLNPQQQSELSKFSSLSGTAFSQAYDTMMVSDHAKTVALFQQEISTGQDPTVVSFAKQVLPMLEEHYQGSQILAASQPGTTATPSASRGEQVLSNLEQQAAGLLDREVARSSSNPSSSSGGGGKSYNAQDAQFVQQATTGGLTEVQEGQLAQNGSTGAREFGLWMVTDHTAMNAKLASIASQEGLSVPATPTPTQEAEISSLQSLSGSQLSSTYASNEVRDHVQTIVQFIAEADHGKDPALVEFAKESIPVLFQHLAGAVDLKVDQLGLSQSAAADAVNTVSGWLDSTPLALSAGLSYVPTSGQDSLAWTLPQHS